MLLPEAGTPLTSDQFEMIMEVVGERKHNFPDEPPLMTLWVVFSNIGDRYAQVECVEQEWTGFKKDIPKVNNGEGPTCPNGHALKQGPRLSIGWVEDKETQKRHGI